MNVAIARELHVSIQYMFQHTVGNGHGFALSAGTPSAKQSQFVASDSPLWLPGLWPEADRIDFEFSTDWRTGSTCDIARFEGITEPIYAAAAGRVAFVGYSRNNGNYVILTHDYNGDGDYTNDGLRTFYLHFETGGIVVSRGQIVAAGELLGAGGMTGMAWTPHLHFEVHRYVDGAWRPVDPYGWQGEGADPWPIASEPLLAP